MKYIKSAFTRFRDFKGTSGRAEFWVFFGYVFVLVHIFAIPAYSILIAQTIRDIRSLDTGKEIASLSQSVPGGMFLFAIATLLSLLHLMPLLAVSVRRLHDTGKRGKWMLLLLIPFLGPVFLLFMLGQKRRNA